MVICPDCGKEVPNARFCKNCGARLPEVEEAVPVPEADEVLVNVDSAVDSNDEVVDVKTPVESSDADEVSVNVDSAVDSNDEVVDVETPVESSEADDEPERVRVTVTADENTNKVNFCRNCGFKLDGNFRFCPNCGYDLENEVSKPNTRAVSTTGEKNIIVSIILSIIFPGLGQIYLGLDKKGAYFLIGYIVSAILILLVIGLILCFVIWIWALVDTIQSTNALNRGETVEDKLF